MALYMEIPSHLVPLEVKNQGTQPSWKLPQGGANPCPSLGGPSRINRRTNKSRPNPGYRGPSFKMGTPNLLKIKKVLQLQIYEVLCTIEEGLVQLCNKLNNLQYTKHISIFLKYN